MNNRYHYDTSRREPARRGGRTTLLDVVVLLLSVALSALLLLSYLAPHVNPNRAWMFALLGLANPVLFIANIVMALYWVLRWKYYIVVPGIAILLGLGNISLFFNPHLKKHYVPQQDKPGLTILSYNVEGFLQHHAGRTSLTMDTVCRLIAAQHPDIACLQEFQVTPRQPRAQVDSLLGALPHSRSHFAIQGTNHSGWGLAIYSRYPVTGYGVVDFEHSSNCAMHADLAIGGDTVRVFNCHLQTTSLTADDQQLITTEQIVRNDTEDTKRRMKVIAGKLRGNYKIRAAQADTMALLVAASPYPVILCGDFNDTPVSYAYRRVRGAMTDAFVEKGRGTAGTYRGFFNMFRIDYVFHSADFHTVSYTSPESDISDHNPVIVGVSRP